jgi:hypothetical protein
MDECSEDIEEECSERERVQIGVSGRATLNQTLSDNKEQFLESWVMDVLGRGQQVPWVGGMSLAYESKRKKVDKLKLQKGRTEVDKLTQVCGAN